MSWPKSVRISPTETKVLTKKQWRRFYERYLKTPHWKGKRREILEWTSGKCAYNCRSCRGYVEVHHNSKGYEHLWEESGIPAVHLIPLCKGHHDTIHASLKPSWELEEDVKNHKPLLEFI